MIVFGKNVAKEVIESGKEINEVFISKTFEEKSIINKLESMGVYIKYMDKN